MTRKRLAHVVAAVALAGTLSACFPDDSDTESTPPDGVESSEAPPADETDAPLEEETDESLEEGTDPDAPADDPDAPADEEEPAETDPLEEETQQ